MEQQKEYVLNMDLFKDINEMDDEDYLVGMSVGWTKLLTNPNHL